MSSSRSGEDPLSAADLPSPEVPFSSHVPLSSDDAVASSYEAIGRELAADLEHALPAWVQRSIERRFEEAYGEVSPNCRQLAAAAASAVRDDVVPAIIELLHSDIDAHRTTPLSLVRSCVPAATSALRALGVPPRERDGFAVERFPDDDYDLVPANLNALGAETGDRAIAWGAAKAFTHRQRHGGPA